MTPPGADRPMIIRHRCYPGENWWTYFYHTDFDWITTEPEYHALTQVDEQLGCARCRKILPPRIEAQYLIARMIK